MNFGEDKKVIARKKYQCEWCLESIEVKEKHHHYKGMWDEDWQNWRMHVECYAEANKDPYILQDGFTPGEGTRPTMTA